MTDAATLSLIHAVTRAVELGRDRRHPDRRGLFGGAVRRGGDGRRRGGARGGASGGDAYKALRSNLGRSILLGLELLVAADIINTVAVEPTLTSIAVLAGIVAIRTFLSFSLELEIEGKWPWQPGRPSD